LVSAFFGFFVAVNQVYVLGQRLLIRLVDVFPSGSFYKGKSQLSSSALLQRWFCFFDILSAQFSSMSIKETFV
jgi:hypothetical protein